MRLFIVIFKLSVPVLEFWRKKSTKCQTLFGTKYFLCYFFKVEMRHFWVIFKHCDYFDHFEYNGDAPEIVSYPFV